MATVIAQTTAAQTTPAQTTHQPIDLGTAAGLGFMIWGAVQIILKIWETRENSRTKLEAMKGEGLIGQNEQALGTVLTAFDKAMTAQIEQNGNLAEARNKALTDRMDKLETDLRQVNITLVDLVQAIREGNRHDG